MQIDPKKLEIPDYVLAEVRRCRERIAEPGLYDVGLLVDANNVMYRLAFAASKDVSSAADMLAVFMDRIRRTVESVGAEVVMCAIDYGEPLRRSMMNAKKKPAKTPEQEAVIALAREALHMIRDGLAENWLNPRFMYGYEADDIVAAYAVSGLCVHTIIYSTDSDLYQVTNGSGIVQLSPDTGKFLKSAVPPYWVPAVKALAGDTSDNIDGVPKIGVKTALGILMDGKAFDVSPQLHAQVLNDLCLTVLPFPGSFNDVSDVLVGVPANTDTGIPTETEDPLPF